MTVTSTIGTAGRNYSTLAAWAASIPATPADAYAGETYNDSEFLSSSQLLSLSGHATTATFTITLTAAAGQSFADNAAAQTNALTYNQSNGVGVRFTGAYANGIQVSDNYVTISRLQVKATSSVGGPLGASGTNFLLDGCILDSASGSRPAFIGSGASSLLRNCLLVLRASGATDGIANVLQGCTFANCTLVAPSDLATKPTTGLQSNYGTAKAENCAVFGAAAVTGGSTAWTFTTCATDVASPPTGFTGALAYASQFVGVTNSASDYRLKSGASLIDTGTTDTTDIPAAVDIVGTHRPQGSAWDIGCWELVQSTGVALAARGAATSAGRASATLAVALAARGAAHSVSRGLLSTGALMALAARGAATSSGRAVMTFALALGARGIGFSHGGASLSATVAIAARGAALSVGRAVLTAQGAITSLVARGFSASGARAALTLTSPLLGKFVRPMLIWLKGG